ncbi:MAG: SDR family oxidoreductase [Anaerolineae bacterium]|nr:SDR family oxidoreductase [Caldilineales bacterium]MDW8270188.1 SDR family oxidoreductase [Anaerolineae bacterium]
MPDFSGQTVVITGASTGIGRATAVAFRRAGARVVLAARSTAELEQLAAELGGPEHALPVTCDVTDPAQCQVLMDRAVAHFGGLDILVNNAGLLVSGTFEHLQPGDLERQFTVNLFGVAHCIRAALPHLKRSRGVIVNVSSVAAFVGTPTSGAYSASKAALNNLGQSLAAELRPYGIAVCTVCPYFVSGAQLARKGIIRGGSRHNPASRRRQAPGTQTVEQVATAILKAAASRRRLMVLSPAGVAIWWVTRLAPWLVDAVLAQAMRRLSR